jgi:hypothetical protein
MNKNKTIWMCWFQGEDHPRMPELNRNCIKRWRELNPDWKVNILSKETIADYVPEYFEIIKNSPNRLPQACSDLVRILLLSKYGGVWADASVYPMIPLSDFYDKIVNDTGFFTYRFLPRRVSRELGDRETVSWFICADKPNQYIIERWKCNFIDEFNLKQNWPYFTFHQVLARLYDTDIHIKNIVDGMIQICEQVPHSALKSWKHKKQSYMYKRPNINNTT